MTRQIHSFKCGNGEISINYTQKNIAGVEESYILKSEDTARPEFYDIVGKNLLDLLLMHFAGFKFCQKHIVVRELEIKYGGEGYESDDMSRFKVAGYMLSKDGEKLKISTDMIKILEDKLIQTYHLLIPVISEIQLFIDGERAQGKLFEDRGETVLEAFKESKMGENSGMSGSLTTSAGTYTWEAASDAETVQ